MLEARREENMIGVVEICIFSWIIGNWEEELKLTQNADNFFFVGGYQENKGGYKGRTPYNFCKNSQILIKIHFCSFGNYNISYCKYF